MNMAPRSTRSALHRYRTVPAPLLENLVAKGCLGRKSRSGFHTWSEGSGEAYDRQERALLERLLASIEEEDG